MTHTPGPWHVGVKTAHHGRDIYGPHGESVAITDDVATFPETAYANARLIAAAPETAAERDRLREVNAELLAACQRLLRVERMTRATYDSDVQMAEAVDQAMGAIARTEGR